MTNPEDPALPILRRWLCCMAGLAASGEVRLILNGGHCDNVTPPSLRLPRDRVPWREWGIADLPPVLQAAVVEAVEEVAWRLREDLGPARLSGTLKVPVLAGVPSPDLEFEPRHQVLRPEPGPGKRRRGVPL